MKFLPYKTNAGTKEYHQKRLEKLAGLEKRHQYPSGKKIAEEYGKAKDIKRYKEKVEKEKKHKEFSKKPIKSISKFIPSFNPLKNRMVVRIGGQK